MKLKSLLSHLVISLLSLWVLGYGYLDYNSLWSTIYAIIHILILFAAYSYSGYVIFRGENKMKLWNYALIAIIGCSLWLICIVDSGGDLDWKNGPGGIWLFYHLYTIGFNLPFSLLPQLNNTLNLILLLLFSILPSFFLMLGGYFRIRNETHSRNVNLTDFPS